MCGIGGFFSSIENPSLEGLDRINFSLRHRGPDGKGTFIDGGVGLAHTRLSIIDLSRNADQPMTSSDGQYTIVYNGEIFNYKELKKELVDAGVSFLTESDTEVVLNAYIYWGVEAFNRFNGMWAFAIWDTAREELLLCRDRFGVKPLYYFFDGDRFCFGSEAKAIFAYGICEPQPDWDWFYQYIAVGYIDTGEETFFNNVKQFPRASYATVKIAEGKLNLEVDKYWFFDLERFRQSYDYKNPVSQLKELIYDSIKLRLRSDVEVGSCLSGGLDSSSIVCIASELLNKKKINTFTSIYKEKEFDELEFAKAVIDKTSANAHFLYPGPEEAMDFSILGAHNTERPCAGASLISQLNVMREVHKNVKVVLDGQGVDEYLAGYHPFYIGYLNSLWNRFRETKSPRKLGIFISKFLSIFFSKNGSRYAQQFAFTYILKLKSKHASLPPLVNKDFPGDVDVHNICLPKLDNPYDDELDNTLYHQFFYVSIPQLLMLEDANSMAFSVEARVPFMDYRIVEFIFGLTMDMKLNGWKTKYILREAMKGVLPLKVEKRKDKKGYPTPYAIWLRGPIKAQVEEIIFSEELKQRKIFDEKALQFYWDEHQKEKGDYSWAIYKALSTEIWFRLFIDKSIQPKIMNNRLTNASEFIEPDRAEQYA